jgi:hypothetical protein
MIAVGIERRKVQAFLSHRRRKCKAQPSFDNEITKDVSHALIVSVTRKQVVKFVNQKLVRGLHGHCVVCASYRVLKRLGL